MIHALEPGPDRIVFQITDVVPSADVPRVSHLCSLTAVSWSMFPTIQKGDVLEIEPVGLVQVGDIVVFSLEDALVCHRVVGFAGREMVHTQGDAVAAQDRPVRLQEIAGRVTTIIRGSGRFAPVSAPPPSLAALARRKMDVSWTELRERMAVWALAVLAFLKQCAPARLIALAVARHVRFYLGVRAPVHALHAYRFMPLADAAGGGGLMDESSSDCPATDDILIEARLGRRRLGTWHPASGAMRIRRAAENLGIEDSLRTAYRRVTAPARPPSCP
jgi:signal peptidase I